jgi:hypothetical protein
MPEIRGREHLSGADIPHRQGGLGAQWDRVPWVWNECVARSRSLRRTGETWGRELDRDVTQARPATRWLPEGAVGPPAAGDPGLRCRPGPGR